MALQPSNQVDESKIITARLPLLAESLDSRGLYIYDDGFRFVLWFGRMLSPDIAMNLLGQEFAAELSRVSAITFEHLFENFHDLALFYMIMFEIA